MEKNGNVPVDNQIKMVFDERMVQSSDAKFKKLETGKLSEVLFLGVGPLDNSSGLALRDTVYPEGLCLDRFLNISPLKMSGNVKYAAAIDTDLTIFSLSSWSDIKKV